MTPAVSAAGPRAQATRNHFHIALVVPLLSLPFVAVIAVIDLVRLKDRRKRFWARMLGGVAVLDAICAVVVIAIATERITPDAITAAADSSDPSRVPRIAAAALAVGAIVALYVLTRSRAGSLRFWTFLVGLLATSMLVIPTAVMSTAEALGLSGQAAMLTAMFAQMGALLILGLLAIRATHPVDPAQERPHLTPPAGWAFGCFYALTLLPRIGLVMMGVMVVTGMQVPAPLPFLEQAGSSPVLGLLVGAVVVVLGPIAEEVAMRGLLLPWLRTSIGATGAVIGSAAVFGLLHAHLGPMVVIPFLYGLIFGWARVATGGLLAPILLHATVNGTVLSFSVVLELFQ